MALTPMDDFTWKYVNQPDEITGDPTALKTNLDSRGKEIRDYLNGTLKDEVDNKQPLNNDLTAIAGLDNNGIIAKTGAGTAQTRKLVAPAAGITVANGDGVSGNPTLALANDLAALEGLATNGLITRTSDGVATTRKIIAPAAGITVTNDDGVSGNPTLALANDLAALEGLAANGIITRTGDGAAAVRTIMGTANQVTVASGDGVSGNPTISLPQNIHSGASPTFAGMTLTGKSGVIKATGGTLAGNATMDDIADGENHKRLTATKDGYINQDVKTTASPTFAGVTVGSLSGVVRASGGVLSGSATLDDVPDSETYKKMTAVKEGYIDQDVTTSASPTFAGGTINGNLEVTGTVDGRDISADIDQPVKTTDSPTFAGLTVDGGTVAVDKVNHRVGIGTVYPTQKLDVDGNIGILGTNVLRLGDKFTIGFNSGLTSLDISYIGE